MSEGDTLTAYMANAAITPRNDKPMTPIVPGTDDVFRRGTSPRFPSANACPNAESYRSDAPVCDAAGDARDAEQEKCGAEVTNTAAFLPPG